MPYSVWRAAGRSIGREKGVGGPTRRNEVVSGWHGARRHTKPSALVLGSFADSVVSRAIWDCYWNCGIQKCKDRARQEFSAVLAFTRVEYGLFAWLLITAISTDHCLEWPFLARLKPCAYSGGKKDALKRASTRAITRSGSMLPFARALPSFLRASRLNRTPK